MMLALLFTVTFIISSASGADIFEISSSTECRNTWNDDINVTVSCTLSGDNHAILILNNQLLDSSQNTYMYDCKNSNCSNVTTSYTGLISASSINSCTYNVTCRTYDGKIESQKFILKDCEILPTPVCNANDDDNDDDAMNITISVLTSFITITPTPITMTTSIIVTKTSDCPSTYTDTTTQDSSKTKAATEHTIYCPCSNAVSTETVCLSSSLTTSSVPVTSSSPAVALSTTGLSATASVGSLLIVILLIVIVLLVIIQCRRKGIKPNNITVSVQNPGYSEGCPTSTIKSIHVQQEIEGTSDAQPHHYIDQESPDAKSRLPSD